MRQVLRSLPSPRFVFDIIFLLLIFFLNQICQAAALNAANVASKIETQNHIDLVRSKLVRYQPKHFIGYTLSCGFHFSVT